jgi:hypothetical protein
MKSKICNTQNMQSQASLKLNIEETNRHGVDRKIFEVMTSTLPKGIIGSVVSMLASRKS